MKPPKFLRMLARRLGVWRARHEVAADPGAAPPAPIGDGFAHYQFRQGPRIVAWLLLSIKDMPDDDSMIVLAKLTKVNILAYSDIEEISVELWQPGVVAPLATGVTGPWRVVVLDERTRRAVSLSEVAAQSPAHAAELRAMLGKALVDLAQKRNGG